MNTRNANAWRTARRGNWLIGCGVALALIVIVIGAIGIFVAMNWRSWASSGLDSALTALVTNLPLDEAQREQTQAVVDDFLARFEDGEVSLAQMGVLMEEISKSPVVPAAIALGVGESYYEKAGLEERAAAEGRRQLARVAHGITEGTIDPQELATALGPIRSGADLDEAVMFNFPTFQVRIKTSDAVTPEEMLAVTERARSVADAHAVAEHPPAFDLAGALDAAIRKAIGEPALDAPPPPPPPAPPPTPPATDTPPPDPGAEPNP